MRNFLILVGAFFGLLILSGQSVYAQCPVQADVIVKTHTNVSCFGVNDGTITVDMSDAATSEPFNFELFDLGAGALVTLSVTETEDKPGRGVVYSDVPPGTYAVLFFKAGCYGGAPLSIIEPPFGFVITEPTALVVNLDDVDPDCFAAVGSGNGQIDISVSGGTSPYTIVWTGPTAVPDGTLSTAANLDAGNYTVTVTDANSCPEVLNILISTTTPADAGLLTGQACGTNSFALSGNAFGAGEIGTWTGPPGVTFSPNANTPTATANNLTVGANILTWTITDDAFICTGSSDNITVTYSNLDMTGSGDVALLCFGETTASGTFTVAGGIAPFTYSVISNTSGATVVLPAPGPTTSVNFSNGGVGVITLQVQDNSGCTDQVTITITQPASPLIITQSPGATFSLACAGDTNGAGSFTASGGTGAYTFTVTTNTTGGTPSIAGAVLSFSGAGAGIISVDVRDANSCLQTSSITITAPPALVLTPSAPTITLLCNGGTNATGSFTASGGTGAHTFTLIGNTTGATTSIVGSVFSFSGAGVGTISVGVRDANNCLQTSAITITAPPALVLTPSSPTITLLCNGDTNGTGNFTASGGTGPYTFTVTTNTTGGTTSIAGAVLSFIGAGPGTISVDVRDANNCLQTSSITITAPPALVLTPSAPSITLLCNGDTDGSGSFTASGGTGAHIFTVSINTTGATTSIVGSVLSFSGAGPGTISVGVRDANNCLQTSSIIIIAPPVLVLTPSAPTITLLCNGDTNGSGNFTVSGGTGPYAFAVTTNTTGGTTVAAGSTLTFTGAGAGIISVDVSDASNCLQSSSITITAPPALVLTPSAATITLLCSSDTNGSGGFTASGGTGAYTFTVTGNNTGATTSIVGPVLSFSGAGPGTISVDVRDANNCLQSSSIIITAPPLLVLSNPGDVTLTCTGGNDATGTFTAGGGTAPYIFTIIQNTTGATTSSTATTFSYANGGGGVLEIQVEDAGGCTQTQLITVTPVVVITLTTSSTDADCLGVDNGSITITGTTGGSGPYEYSLDGGTFTTSLMYPNLSAGDHTIVARDALGCTSSSVTVTIGATSIITFTSSSTATTVCAGSDGSITVTGSTGGSGTYNYLLNGVTVGAAQPDNFIFTNLTAGIYQVVVEDNATGCTSAMQLVTVDSPVGCVLNCFAFTVEVDPQTQRPACNGGQDGVIALKVTASTPIVLVTVYKSGDPVPAPIPNVSGFVFVFNDLEEGTYEYRIEDPLGNVCVQSFVWDAVTNIQAAATSPEDSKCFGTASGSVILDATGSSTGEYFFSVDGTTWTEFLPGSRVTGLPGNGTYNIRVGGIENDVCYDEVSVTIAQLGIAELDTLYVSPVSGFPAVSYPESPTATRVIGIDGSGAPPYEIQLRLIDPYGIELNPPFITSWTLVDETTPLGIPQKQMNELYAGVYELAVRDAVGCERTYSFIIELDDRVFIPNIFTPNNDKFNDTFFVRNLPEKGSTLSITDRWGKQVYSSNNYNPDTLWDGGNTPDGVYFYSLHIKDGKTYTGWIEILRGIKP